MKKLLIMTLLAASLLTACAASTDKGNALATTDTTTEEATTEATTSHPDQNLPEDAFGFSVELKEDFVVPGEYFHIQVSMTNKMDKAYQWTGTEHYYAPRGALIAPDGTVYDLGFRDSDSSDDYDYYSVEPGETYTYGSSDCVLYDAELGMYDLVLEFKNSRQTFEDVLEVGTFDKEAYRSENAFGFTYNGMEGTADRNKKIRVDVVLTNQMDCDYEWFGSSGGFGADAYLVSAVNPAYKISHPDMPIPDDSGYHKVAPGAARSREFEFTIPTDAPAGAYNLVCQFRHSQQTFEGVFELE